MKRSEVIAIIESCLYGELKDESQEAAEGLAKVIMSHVEGTGMKPPYNDEGLSNYDIAMGSDVYKWEEEDV